MYVFYTYIYHYNTNHFAINPCLRPSDPFISFPPPPHSSSSFRSRPSVASLPCGIKIGKNSRPWWYISSEFESNVRKPARWYATNSSNTLLLDRVYTQTAKLLEGTGVVLPLLMIYAFGQRGRNTRKHCATESIRTIEVITTNQRQNEIMCELRGRDTTLQSYCKKATEARRTLCNNTQQQRSFCWRAGPKSWPVCVRACVVRSD